MHCVLCPGRLLADRVYGGVEGAKVEYEYIPTVVFSHPPLGSTGITEPQAIAKDVADKIKVYKGVFPQMYYGEFHLWAWFVLLHGVGGAYSSA